MPNKAKHNQKSRKKDSQLIIRVNRQERDDFVSLCEELDTSAAREIRHFMRSYLHQHRADEPSS